MKIAIVTDSTADIPAELVKKHNLTVVPLYVTFGDETYKSGVELSNDKFYEMLVERDDFPSTSQPSVGDFLDTYRKLLKDHDHIITIVIAASLSGTMNSATSARQELGDQADKVTIIDSKTASMTLGMTAIHASQKAAQGKSIAEIVEGVQVDIDSARLMAIADTLEYLRAGGRIGAVRFFLGSMMNLRVLVGIEQGALLPIGKAFSHDGVINLALKTIQKLAPKKEIYVIYTTRREEAEKFAERVREILQLDSKVGVTQLGPVTGAHTGPGTLGIAYFSTKDHS